MLLLGLANVHDVTTSFNSICLYICPSLVCEVTSVSLAGNIKIHQVINKKAKKEEGRRLLLCRCFHTDSAHIFLNIQVLNVQFYTFCSFQPGLNDNIYSRRWKEEKHREIQVQRLPQVFCCVCDRNDPCVTSVFSHSSFQQPER